MARLFNTGLETAGAPARTFTTVTHGDVSIVNTQARTGTYSLELQAFQFANRYGSIAVAPASDELFLGFGFQHPTTDPLRLFQTDGLDVTKLQNTNVLRFAVNAGNYDTALSLIADTWYWIEIHIVRSATVGVLQVRIDGNLDIDESNINTGAGTPTYSRWVAQDLDGSHGHLSYADDIVINDASGSGDNSWPGDIRLEPGVVDASGDVSDWSLSPDGGESDWEDVDEVPATDDTDYLHHDTDTEEFLLNLPAWAGSNKAPQKVHIWVCARREGANAADQIMIAAKQGGTTVASDGIALLTSYRNYCYTRDTAPDGGAWTNAKIDALQIGARVHDA